MKCFNQGLEMLISRGTIQFYQGLFRIDSAVEKLLETGMIPRVADQKSIIASTVREMRAGHSKHDMTAEALYRCRRQGYDTKASLVYPVISALIRVEKLAAPRQPMDSYSTPSGVRWRLKNEPAIARNLRDDLAGAGEILTNQ
jgi:hypothetical protein